MIERAPTVACIGSFRRESHLAVMGQVFESCAAVGIQVTNPPSITPLNPGEPFVRLPEDEQFLQAAGIPPTHPQVNAAIEMLALRRIVRASAVYVVCPDARIGNTTAYELAQVISRRVPTYFSAYHNFAAYPLLDMMLGRIVTPGMLARLVSEGRAEPLPDYYAALGHT